MSEWQEVFPRVKARARQIDEDETFVGTNGRVDAPAGSWILEQKIGDTRYSYVLLEDDFHRQWLVEGEKFDEEDYGDEIAPLPTSALATVGTMQESDPNVRTAAEAPDYGAQETDRANVPATDNATQEADQAPDADEDAEVSTDTTTRSTGATDSDENNASEMPPVGNTLEEKGRRTR
jgi:hypothetical protein